MTSEGEAHEGGEGSPGPLPPQDDRLWRHPSELGGGWAPPRAGRVGRPAVSVLTGIALGVAVTTAAVTVGGRLGGPGATGTTAGSGQAAGEDLVVAPTVASRSQPQGRPGPATVGATLAGPADRVAGSMVRLEVDRDGGPSRGTGVVYRAGGLVLTTNGLVAGARAVWAVDRQGRRTVATVVGSDPVTDVAVVRLTGAAPPPVDAIAAAAPGEVVAVVGWAAGGSAGDGPWRPELLMGTVGGVYRGLQTTGGSVLIDAVAADTPAADGAEGAPLVDVGGRLLGLVARPGGSDSATLAVGAAMAAAVADELVATGRVEHGWIGVAGTARPGGGVTLTLVMPEGPAAEAGLRAGDVVIAADGRPVSTLADLLASARLKRPGQTESLTMARGPLRWTCTVTLAEPPPSP